LAVGCDQWGNKPVVGIKFYGNPKKLIIDARRG